MAGHSKWANIRFRKAGQDAKRGKIFTKIIREITIAARMGGGEPATNPRLRAAIDKGLGENMKRDTINSAIARGIGATEDTHLMECRYEGYAPGGVAVLVDCLTDNKNRTVAEVRHAFTKAGGSLGTDGSVAYLFTKQGQINFPKSSNEERIMEVALEAGAEDISTNEDGSIDVVTTPETFMDVKQAMQDKQLIPEYSDIMMSAALQIKIDDLETAEKIIRLIDTLEDLDDVQNVYSNADISKEILERMQ